MSCRAANEGRVPVEPAAADPLTPARLFAEYAPRVYHLARRLLGNDADAEDVTQQVFLQVVRKLHTFRGDSAFGTWLNRVTVHAALAARQRRAAREDHERGMPPEEFEADGRHARPVRRWRTPEAVAIEHETHELIERAIAGLPVVYRDVYVLADVEELPNQDIADLLGLSVAAVKSRLHRARLRMRHALAPYFEERAA